MKQISTLFFAGMLMSALCVAFVACNKPNGLGQKDPLEGVGIAPVPETEIPKEVTAFFEENPAGSIFKLEFDQTEEKKYDPVCLMINSLEEFRAATLSSVELPYIDFDNYTLVFARYYTTGGTYLKNQGVDTKPDVMIFNLVFGDTGKGLGAMFERFTWGLYPKLPQKAITFNFVTIKEY